MWLSLEIPLILLVLHFVGDFLFQSDWMATNKSRSWKALGLHILAYSLPFVGFGAYILWDVWSIISMWPEEAGDLLWMVAKLYGAWFLFNMVLHFVTDAITSRITSALWFFKPVAKVDPYDIQLYIAEGGSRHWFFVMIGFDQLIHFVTLALTWRAAFGSGL